MTAGRGAAAALALLVGCGLPDPEPLPRIVRAAPTGSGVSTEVAPEIVFSAAADPAGLLDGRLLALVPAEAQREAVLAVESDAGASGLGSSVAVRSALEDAGRRLVLRPLAPLRGLTAYAVVLSSRLRAADGRTMLDPDGRRRTFVAAFETGQPSGPPPLPALTEVRADAATPEAGGEYVEVVNLGSGPLDLSGWRLAKRTTAGALASCEISGGATVLRPGEVALVAGGSYDARYAVPAGVAVLRCGATALLGGLANDRVPEVLLADPTGTVHATIGAAGASICPAALEKLDPAGADEPDNLACSEGTPGTITEGQ